jgi:hypothetical protein
MLGAATTANFMSPEHNLPAPALALPELFGQAAATTMPVAIAHAATTATITRRRLCPLGPSWPL